MSLFLLGFAVGYVVGCIAMAAYIAWRLFAIL